MLVYCYTCISAIIFNLGPYDIRLAYQICNLSWDSGSEGTESWIMYDGSNLDTDENLRALLILKETIHDYVLFSQ